jgi:hypothetical protein
MWNVDLFCQRSTFLLLCFFHIFEQGLHTMGMKPQAMECAGGVKTLLIELSSFEKSIKKGKIVVSLF